MLFDAGSCFQRAAGPPATAWQSCTQNRGLLKLLGARYLRLPSSSGLATELWSQVKQQASRDGPKDSQGHLCTGAAASLEVARHGRAPALPILACMPATCQGLMVTTLLARAWTTGSALQRSGEACQQRCAAGYIQEAEGGLECTGSTYSIRPCPGLHRLQREHARAVA